MTTPEQAPPQLDPNDLNEILRSLGRIEATLTHLAEGQREIREDLRSTNHRLDEFQRDTNRHFEENQRDTNRRFEENQRDFNLRLDEFQRHTNQRIDDTNHRIDRLFYTIAGFGAILTGALIANIFV